MCDYLGHAALRGYAIGLNAGSYLVQTASDGGATEYMGLEPDNWKDSWLLERQLTSGKDRREE